MMKSIIFRPLRRIKKTGKITVASYMQWNKVRCADYNKFNLVVDNNYNDFPSDEYIYDHKGELLYWPTHLANPAQLRIFDSCIDFDYDGARAEYKSFGIDHGTSIFWLATGIDCCGTPTFSHWTTDYCADHYERVDEVEPLTVGIVVKWFGWFLLQLNNSYLQIGK